MALNFWTCRGWKRLNCKYHIILIRDVEAGKEICFMSLKNFKTYILKFLSLNNSITFKNVKFADKLKDCVCILLGCTRSQLEDREFKESYLSSEWDEIFVFY